MYQVLCEMLYATPWTVSHQAPPSMEFSRQEYWSGVPFPSAQENSGQIQSPKRRFSKKSVPLPGETGKSVPLATPLPISWTDCHGEASGQKGSRKAFSGVFHSLISIRVTDPALCYEGHSHDTQGRGSGNQFLITKSTASGEFLPEPGTFIKRQAQPLLQHQPQSLGRQHEAPSPAPRAPLPGPVCWVRWARGSPGGGRGLSLVFLPPSVLLPSSTRGQTKPTVFDASEKPVLSP